MLMAFATWKSGHRMRHVRVTFDIARELTLNNIHSALYADATRSVYMHSKWPVAISFSIFSVYGKSVSTAAGRSNTISHLKCN
jgi:hypothetical protein